MVAVVNELKDIIKSDVENLFICDDSIMFRLYEYLQMKSQIEDVKKIQLSLMQLSEMMIRDEFSDRLSGALDGMNAVMKSLLMAFQEYRGTRFYLWAY